MGVKRFLVLLLPRCQDTHDRVLGLTDNVF